MKNYFKVSQLETTFAKGIDIVKNKETGEIVSATRLPIAKFDYSFNVDFSLAEDAKLGQVINALLVKQVKEIVRSNDKLTNCTVEEYKPLLEKLVSEVSFDELFDSLLGENRSGNFGANKFCEWIKPIFAKVKEVYKTNNSKELPKQIESALLAQFKLGQRMPETTKIQILDWIEKFSSKEDETVETVITWIMTEPAKAAIVPSNLI